MLRLTLLRAFLILLGLRVSRAANCEDVVPYMPLLRECFKISMLENEPIPFGDNDLPQNINLKLEGDTKAIFSFGNYNAERNIQIVPIAKKLRGISPALFKFVTTNKDITVRAEQGHHVTIIIPKEVKLGSITIEYLKSYKASKVELISVAPENADKQGKMINGSSYIIQGKDFRDSCGASVKHSLFPANSSVPENAISLSNHNRNVCRNHMIKNELAKINSITESGSIDNVGDLKHELELYSHHQRMLALLRLTKYYNSEAAEIDAVPKDPNTPCPLINVNFPLWGPLVRLNITAAVNQTELKPQKRCVEPAYASSKRIERLCAEAMANSCIRKCYADQRYRETIIKVWDKVCPRNRKLYKFELARRRLLCGIIAKLPVSCTAMNNTKGVSLREFFALDISNSYLSDATSMWPESHKTGVADIIASFGLEEEEKAYKEQISKNDKKTKDAKNKKNTKKQNEEEDNSWGYGLYVGIAAAVVAIGGGCFYLAVQFM